MAGKTEPMFTPAKIAVHALTYVPPLVAYFDGKTAGWKVIKVKKEDGTETEVIELKDGNPVWIGADGAESTLGGDTIKNLNAEAARHRKDKEAAETALATFKDIDPVKAREALETVGKIDQKKLIDVGEVDRVKNEIAEGFKGQLTAAEERAIAAEKRVTDLTLETAFNGSTFIKDKIAVPVDMVRNTFGNRFKVGEDGKIEVYDPDGKTRMFSKAKQGEYADFEEGIALVVEGYAAKDAILKGGNQSGGGSGGGGGGGKPGVRRYSRDEFQKLPPAEQQSLSKEIPLGKVEVYDAT